MASVKPSIHQLAGREACDELIEARGRYGRQAAQNLIRSGDADVVFGEVDAGLQQRDQFEQAALYGLDSAGNGAIDLLGGDAGLIKRRGVDQIANGFGLRQIDAAVDR